MNLERTQTMPSSGCAAVEAVQKVGHEGTGGIQKWSCGDVYPWTIYTIEYYVPSDRVPGVNANGRFLWAEIRMSHPEGRDEFLADYFRGPHGRSDELAKIAHEQAEKKALQIASRPLNSLEFIRKIMRYGQPDCDICPTADECNPSCSAAKRPMFLH